MWAWSFNNLIHFQNQYTIIFTYGPKIHGIKNKKVLDEIVEKSLHCSNLE